MPEWLFRHSSDVTRLIFKQLVRFCTANDTFLTFLSKMKTFLLGADSSNERGNASQEAK